MQSRDRADNTPQFALYRTWLAETYGLRFRDYAELWTWSTTELERFWESLWAYGALQSPTPYAAVLRGGMPGAVWFEGAQVNYARQVFRHAEAAEAAGQPAIIAEDERGRVAEVGWRELRRRTASLALELRRAGVGRGDRVAAYLPNAPEAVVALLACASLGAIWTLCSPDMGTPAVLDRFRQVTPKALIAVDGVHYGGRPRDRSAVVREIRRGLPSLQAVLVLRTGYGDHPVDEAIDLLSAQARDDDEVAAFEPEWLPFDHPLWILYSSGTTGLPKAIVHGHGGVVLAGCAGALHLDLGPSYAPNTFGERFHWYSSTGWVMWNVQVGGLLSGTTICLFDGSPGGARQSADWGTLWRFAARRRVTWFGAGAAFFMSCRKAGLSLAESGDLGAIRALGSTGSPLPAEVEAWGSQAFAQLGRRDIWWCNISGGTDIAAAFLSGNRELPSAPGRLQCRHLGAAVEAWDEDGRPVVGRVGELVCTRPFPSMPLFFWGDADGQRYRASYFGEWPGVWRHGDWLQIEPDGTCSISGRSDATINRNGLRMGTAELYAAVERLPEVADSLVIDLEDGQGGSRLLMFVVPSAGRAVDEGLQAAMAGAIRDALSPRFVPDAFIQAPGVPRTLSGKKQELPVKRLFQGWPLAKVINVDGIENPGVVAWYQAQAEAWRGADRVASRASSVGME
ncbi:acetoacetate--CoA ligase [Phenylobacterium sp.]|uniref:acetoacetate--CoA ligase n=1 Tax=Phenylobacterium sp. TaxID=1871053 RepID=UPI0035B1ACC8